jgi:putative acetyltransferase
MDEIVVRRARLEESDAVATMFRASRETAMPYLPALHTPEEGRAFFREHVFPRAEVWIAERVGVPAGFSAVHGDWLEHLYVHPGHQRAGLGNALLLHAMQNRDALYLWTFQRNANARAFYEKRGFAVVRTTGGENEEREPDVLYAWTRANKELGPEPGRTPS